MRRSFIGLITISLFFVGTLCFGGIDLGDIAGLIEQSAAPDSGISQKGQETAKRIQSLGPCAIPYLLPLLKHQRKDVRELTSFILRGMDGLGEEHLDALIESRLRGDGWIPPAIAKIGTERAIAFLVDELKKERQTHTQLTFAFKILAEKGTPYLVELIRNEAFDEQLMTTVVFIFGELKEKAESAVEPLIEIVSSRQGDEKSAKYAVLALGAIGPGAQCSTPVLLGLAQSDPERFREIVNRSLQTMGVPQAITGLLKRLNEKPDLVVFRDIAALKENGKGAGPSLVRFLWHDDWDARVGAARAMGYIGYTEVIPELIKLLGTEHDWRLVYVTVESLGRLHAVEAVPALTDVSTSYWYPTVREAAQKAVLSITQGSQYRSRYHQNNFAFEFFDYEGIAIAANLQAVRDEYEKKVLSDGGEKDSLDNAQLKKLAYKVDMRPFIAAPEPKKGDFTKIQVPGAGVRVKDGYLVGSSRGEWGGELVFIKSKGKQISLFQENVQGIHKLNSDIVVVTGLAHLTFNRGFLYKVSRMPHGQWQLVKWRALPGAPRSSALLRNGNLLVNCLGGNVEIYSSGKIELVEQ